MKNSNVSTGSQPEQTETHRNPDQENSPPGTIDLERIKLPQNFGQLGASVKKVVTTIPIRKPNRQEFVRVHPNDNFAFQAGILEIKDENEIFIVDKNLLHELPGEIVPKILVTTINRQGTLSLWPIKLPDNDGRIDQWNHSAMDAASRAKKQWIRMAANRNLGAYEIFVATGDLPEPEWPDMDMQAILNIAFRDRIIKNMDHSAVKRLRGA